MSGIAGLHAETRPDSGLLQAMALRLAHRGQARQFTHLCGKTGFALACRDTDANLLPLRSADGRLTLIADGALDNGVALRAQLAAAGQTTAGRHDWELVFDAYRTHGDDFPVHLEGAYALALHDADRGCLLLARDRLGIRPLYLSHTVYGWAFASEPKALLPVIGTPAIDSRALAQYLQCGFSTGRATLFARVERLHPGEIAIFGDDEQPVRHRYWSLGEQTLAAHSGRDATARFDQLRATVMEERTHATDAILLDTGDTGAALLRAFGRKPDETPLRTLVVDITNAASDAAPTALAHDGGGRRAMLRIGIDAVIERLALAAWATDDLLADVSIPVRLLVAESLDGEPVRMLAGDGCSEVFGDAPRYRLPRMQRWLNNILEPGSGGFRTSARFRGQERAMFGIALQRATQDWREEFVSAWSATPRKWSRLQRMQSLDLATFVPDHLLPALDRPLSGSGLDWSAPWLDHRLVAFGLGLPDRLKKSGRATQGFIHRRAAALPPFPAPVASGRNVTTLLSSWLSGDTLDRFERILPASPAIRAWFQPEAVRMLCTMKREGRPVTRILAALLQFALWHRIFIEGDGERPEPCEPLDFLARRE